jgi:hypothetical protein
MNLHSLGAVMLGINFAACSAGPVPVSRSMRDPSNPSAPEGVPPAAMTVASDGAPAGVYVCPMHPDVTSSAPGRCPKCGMDLVPKK